MRDFAMEGKWDPSPLSAHIQSRYYVKAWLYKTPRQINRLLERRRLWDESYP